jgi:hypothetical protein
MFLSKYGTSLDRNNYIASLVRTQYTPDFLIGEYYGLRDTIFWVIKDLASSDTYRIPAVAVEPGQFFFLCGSSFSLS